MALKLILLAGCMTYGMVRAQDLSPTADILSDLRAEHPRLIITGPMWRDLKDRRSTDPALGRHAGPHHADGTGDA